MQTKILPSLLAADYGTLAAEARRAEVAGADALHLDIMDGHFVPNLSFGPDVVEMANRTVSIPLSVHLMLSRPDQYLNRFIEAGANTLFIHIEAECDVLKALARIRSLGARPGITVNPDTAAEIMFPALELVDEILCMTVHPGYGGQSFIADVLPKIRAVRDRCNAEGKKDMDIMVDGGVGLDTIADCAAAGANEFVAGTSLYKAADMAGDIKAMRERVAESFRG